MNVVIALASSSGQLSGVQRHAINLARCLLTRKEISDVHLIAAPWQLEFVLDLLSDISLQSEGRLHLHAAPIGNSALSRNWWFYAHLPKLAKHLEADIVHLAYPVPTDKHAFHCPTVVTLHDLYPYDIPENFGFPKIFFNRFVLRQCLRSVDSIACVSQTTLTRLGALDTRLADKATVIYNSVEAQTGLTDPQRPLLPVSERPFLLCVAQHRRNKNVLLTLHVFERVLRAREQTHGMRSLHLVIVGIPGPETTSIVRYIADAKLTHCVTLLHGISDRQLQWCYRNCSLLLAPSAIEGFGLPVAEALLAGCRVLCSDIPAFRELGGNHCHYVPLGDGSEEHFTQALISMMQNELVSDSPMPVALPQLSSSVIADAYLRLYHSLLPEPIHIKDQDASSILTAQQGRQHS